MTGPAPYRQMPDGQLRARWREHFALYDNADAVFDRLVAVYRTPGRYYHTVEHGLEVATTVRTLTDGLSATDVDDLTLAAWTHDAHFDSDASGDENESRSAGLAQRAAQEMGYGPDRARRVGALVRVSSHTVRPANNLEAMLCDADLATLAKPWPDYCADVANIRAELRIDDDAAWRTTRLGMLAFFDDKDPLYYGPESVRRWETNAIENRRRERSLLDNR